MGKAGNLYSLFLFRITLSFPSSQGIDIVMFLASMVKAGRYRMSETMTLDRFAITVPPITT